MAIRLRIDHLTRCDFNAAKRGTPMAPCFPVLAAVTSRGHGRPPCISPPADEPMPAIRPWIIRFSVPASALVRLTAKVGRPQLAMARWEIGKPGCAPLPLPPERKARTKASTIRPRLSSSTASPESEHHRPVLVGRRTPGWAQRLTSRAPPAPVVHHASTASVWLHDRSADACGAALCPSRPAPPLVLSA